MMRSLGRSAGRQGLAAAVVSLCLLGATPTAPGQEPEGATGGVAVAGVPDTFDTLREKIAAVRKDSGRQYRVIVLGDGEGRSATEVLDGILQRWQRQRADNTLSGLGTGFDPDNDVTILVDKRGRAIAMRVPAELKRKAGLDEKTIRSDLIERVFAARAANAGVGDRLEKLVAATEARIFAAEKREQARVAADQAREESARVFRTQTLPALLVGSAVALGLAALAAQWFRHRRLAREARRKLAAFKEEVVALSDLLDDQQERHRMLPHADPDFRTPMQGQTQATYEGVQESILRYRERWLSLMEVWEKAENRIKDEWWLGTAASRDVISLLESAAARPPLADVAGACRAPLDQLEAAHETGRDLLGRLETRLGAVGKRVAALAARGRSGASFQSGLAEASRALDLSRHDVESDPVMARGRLEGSLAALDRGDEALAAFEAADDRRKGVVGAIDGAEALVRTRRAEGWLLAEPGADPSAHVAEARRHEQVAAGLLDAGEVEAAAGHLDAADREVAETLALVENVAAARKRCDELLPTLVARLDGFAAARQTAGDALRWLAAAAADASWDDIADNVAKADEAMSRARALVGEARTAADPGRQHSFRALALFEEAARQLEWAFGCLTAIGERQREIAVLAEALPGRISDAGERFTGLAARLERQRTDRARANEQCREAGRLVEVAERAVRVDRPDFPRTAQVVDAADVALARAVELADDDDRLAHQAAGAIEEADGMVRRVASWYGEGVSADVSGAVRVLEGARTALQGRRYEDAIAAAAEGTKLAREAHALATAEARRRRQQREMEVQRRQMEEAFVRMSRGSGPWVIQLPTGRIAGPDPWSTLGPGGRGGGGSVTGAGGWSSGTVEGRW
ncbi:MAG: hypothetical protein ACKO9B_15990 [Planctomycetota bacterium]